MTHSFDMAGQFGRYGSLVRYDAESGALWLPGAAGDATPATTLDAVFPALDWLQQAEPQATELAAAAALVLVAQEWAERPTDARRGAIIQAARQLSDYVHTTTLLDQTERMLDAALVAGNNPLPSVLAQIEEATRTAQRAAERCGRYAAELLDTDDQLLVCGFGGPPVAALFQAAKAVAPKVLVQEGDKGGAIAARFAEHVGLGVRSIAPGEIGQASLCMLVALALDAEGNAWGPPGSAALLAQATSAGVPRYILAPNGPNHAPLQNFPTDVIPATVISTVVTDQGLFRPGMLDRYKQGGAPPLDVIPLG